MKKLIAAAIALAACAPAVASEELNSKDHCAQIHEVAEVVMEARQKGMPMPRLMSLSEGDALFESLVLEAYAAPRMSAPRNQQDLVNEFANDTYLQCMKAN